MSSNAGWNAGCEARGGLAARPALARGASLRGRARRCAGAVLALWLLTGCTQLTPTSAEPSRTETARVHKQKKRGPAHSAARRGARRGGRDSRPGHRELRSRRRAATRSTSPATAPAESPSTAAAPEAARPDASAPAGEAASTGPLASANPLPGAAAQVQSAAAPEPSPSPANGAAAAAPVTAPRSRPASGFAPPIPVPAPPPRSAAPARSEPWIEVDAPLESEIVRAPLGLVELRGRLGGEQRSFDDIVIALDRSQSTLLPSGLDLDNDGIVGELAPDWANASGPQGNFEDWTTDPEDTVFRAAQLAVGELLGALDPERTRVALLTFSGEAELLAPLGSTEQARAALRRAQPREDWTGSDLSEAVRKGLQLLKDGATPGRTAQRALFLVSDGLPTAPRDPTHAARRARQLAREAHRQGVAIYTFEIQHREAQNLNDSEVLSDMAELAGGRWMHVERPQALRFELPHSAGEAAVQLEVENETTGAPARAVRAFPNGSFDGIVALEPGLNRIRIWGRLRDGRSVESVRLLSYEPQGEPDEDAKRAVLEKLRQRTAETRGWTHQPRPISRGLTILPEPAPEGSAPPAAPGTGPAQGVGH